MTPEQFCYWLQGWIESNKSNGLNGISGDEVEIIHRRLDLALKYESIVAAMPLPDITHWSGKINAIEAGK